MTDITLQPYLIHQLAPMMRMTLSDCFHNKICGNEVAHDFLSVHFPSIAPGRPASSQHVHALDLAPELAQDRVVEGVDVAVLERDAQQRTHRMLWPDGLKCMVGVEHLVGA
jgi:hypothetical protein